MSLDLKVRRLLFKMGVPVHLKGFEYLVECTKEAVEKGADISFCREYKKIGSTHNAHWKAVERAARYAIAKSTERCPDELVLSVLMGNKKPSISCYVSSVAEYCKIGGEHDKES